MGILRKIAALTAVFAAALLLFVVVCPFTPTPNAVIRSDHGTPASPHIVIAAVAAVALALLSFAFVSFESTAESVDSVPQLSVLSRTCVQLC